MSKILIWKIVSAQNPFLVRGKEILVIVTDQNIFIKNWFENFSLGKISNQIKIEVSKWHFEA